MKRHLSTILLIVVILAACAPSPIRTPTEEPSATEAPLNHVLVLVVDTFTLEAAPDEVTTEAQQGEATEVGEPAAATESGTCTVTPDGQGEFGGRSPRPATMEINGEPHGFYVYRQIVAEVPSNERVVQSEGFNASFPDLPWVKRTDYWETETGNVLFVAVDTNGLETESIINNTRESIDFFTNPLNSTEVHLGDDIYPAFDKVAVNMSFAYVPCGEPKDYIDAPLAQLIGELGLNLTNAERESLQTLGDAYYSGKDIEENNLYNYINQPCTYGDRPNCTEINRTWVNSAASLRNRFNFNYDEDQELVDEAMFEAFITHLIYSPDDLTDEDAYSNFRTENETWIASVQEFMGELIEQFPDATFVAAAGNSNLSYPYLPASLAPVISVSSQGNDTNRPCSNSVFENSNCGEVTMDGEYFVDNTVTGTSIAAPRFSFRVAHNLVLGQTCPLDNYNYSSDSGPWDNLVYNCSP